MDLLRQIRSLLYDEGYTIKGAQKLLRARRTKPAGREPAATAPAAAKPAAPPAPAEGRAPLEALRLELIEIRDLLRRARAAAR